jgi:hypothetical protein
MGQQDTHGKNGIPTGFGDSNMLQGYMETDVLYVDQHVNLTTQLRERPGCDNLCARKLRVFFVAIIRKLAIRKKKGEQTYFVILLFVERGMTHIGYTYTHFVIVVSK